MLSSLWPGVGMISPASPMRRKELPAFGKSEQQIVSCETVMNGRDFGAAKRGGRLKRLGLALHQDQLCAKLLEFLDKPRMIGMEMRRQDILDLRRRDSLTLELRRELGQRPRPAAVNQQLSALYIQCVVVGGMVADVDDVHGIGRYTWSGIRYRVLRCRDGC